MEKVGRGVLLWWRCGRLLWGVARVWALRWNDGRVCGGRGNGYGPRVHTGIVTPLPPLLPWPTTNSGGTAVLSSQLLYHSATSGCTTYLLSPLSPRRKLISSPCTCIRTYVCVCACEGYIYICIYTFVCECIHTCVRVCRACMLGGVRPHHLSGTAPKALCTSVHYTRILYMSYIANAVGYPIPNVPLYARPHFPYPEHQYLLHPSAAEVDKAQPEVAEIVVEVARDW